MPPEDAFADALLDPAKVAPFVIHRSPGRFDIYRNNVVVSLIDTLEQVYPAVRQLVGEEYFRALAGLFVRSHPPASVLMHQFGSEFPAFVEAFEPLREFAYLPDVARLEWARVRAWNAADVPTAQASHVADLAQFTQSRIVLHPSATLIRSPHPVASLWEAQFAEPAAEIDDWESERVVVFRMIDRVGFSMLDPFEARFLAQLDDFPVFGDVLLALGDEQDAAHALRIALNLLKAGALVLAPTSPPEQGIVS